MQRLASPPWGPRTPNTYLDWSKHTWEDYPATNPDVNFYLQWASQTTPPSISPFEFSAYGYASCTGTATMLTYVARAVGIPARVVGAPCWNYAPFAGLAKDNKNVSLCWNGGDGKSVGGQWLFNHNWVEYWDNVKNRWVFINVPPTHLIPNEGLCTVFSEETGCDYSPTTGCTQTTSPGLASKDHEIFSVTWDFEGENDFEGGEVVDVSKLTLSNGEQVSPLVWSPGLKSPSGTPLKNVGLRVVNRTNFYRCRDPKI